MRYLSVCSGIEAATVAWHPLGWAPAAFAEIEKFPVAVLQHHYPTVFNLGDMTNYKEWNIGNIDILVGGTPCQSFSVAGLRKGLDDPRGNLALVYLGIAERFLPRWILWENVPGVLSSYSGPEPPSDLAEGQEWETEETSDFECFTTALVQLGYGFAYRVLDAQYFGVPQRRRRVFVVGYLGDWRPPAAVLFERHSLSGDTPPSREKGKGTAGDVAIGIDEECNATKEGFGPLLRGGQGGTRQAILAFTSRDNGRDVAEECSSTLRAISNTNGHQAGSHGVAICQPVANPLTARMAKGINTTCDEGQTMVQEIKQVQWASGGGQLENDTAQALRAGAEHNYQFVRNNMQVRRLTPIECERLQGFPDNYTRIPWRGKSPEQCPDGPRYKALGNSMAVPVMRWIGKRIQAVDKIVTPITK